VQSAIGRQAEQISVGFEEMAKNFQVLQAGIENLRLENNGLQDTTEVKNIVNAFNTGINYVRLKDRNSVCAPDTGQWFFHHPEYEAFQNAKGSQLLFVTAEAGGGKSTTMRTLIDTIKVSDGPAFVAYFFFKDEDDRLRSYDNALSTLIYQFLVQERGFVQHAKEPYRKYGDAIRHHTKEMWQILVMIASQARRNIFCVLDAVDECAQSDRKQLIADLADVFQDTARPTSRLKFIASSRPYQDENHPYADLVPGSNIRHLAGENAQVQSDILKLIRKLRNRMLFFNDPLSLEVNEY
jgi:hypothetical protein